MIRGAGRTAFHFLTRSLSRIATHWPAAALHGADLLGLALRAGAPEDDVRLLFPHLPLAARRRIVRRSHESAMRNLLVFEILRHHGLPPVRSMVIPSDALAALRPPAIIGLFHVGPVTAMAPAVEQLRGNVFVLRRSSLSLERAPNITVETAEGDEQRRALAFYRALERLKAGEFVTMALDPEQAFRIPAPCLGQTLQLARGPFALARIAGVPIVPVVPRWHGARIEIEVGEPIEAAAHEDQLAAAAAAWLERYLLAHPDELTLRIAELLRQRPV